MVGDSAGVDTTQVCARSPWWMFDSLWVQRGTARHVWYHRCRALRRVGAMVGESSPLDRTSNGRQDAGHRCAHRRRVCSALRVADWAQISVVFSTLALGVCAQSATHYLTDLATIESEFAWSASDSTANSCRPFQCRAARLPEQQYFFQILAIHNSRGQERTPGEHGNRPHRQVSRAISAAAMQ